MKQSNAEKKNSETYKEEVVSEWDGAGVFSKWTYRVVNPMLEKGEQKPLEEGDLMLLPKEYHCRKLIDDLQENYSKSSERFFIPRLVIALCKTQPFVFFLSAVLTAMEGAFRVSTPVVLGFFLEDLEDEDSPRKNIFLIALLLSALNALQTLSHHILFYYTMQLGYTFRTVVIGVIFNKLFSLPGSVLDSTSMDTGMLINLISNDVQRFEEAAIFVNFLWEALLEAAAILLFLSYQLNFISGLAGVGMTIITIPIQMKVAKELAKRRGKVARSTDDRVKFMSEVISGISSVKSFAWEQSFFSFVSNIRLKEIVYMKISLMLKAINYALYFCSPHVSSFATFVTFVALGGKLTLPKVFSVMSLLQILRTIMGRLWTRAIETCSEAKASCGRIENFLAFSNDASHEHNVHSESDRKESAVSSAVNGLVLTMPVKCNFTYTNATHCVLRDIKLSISSGELLMVVGPVGAGKSSLLASILGDLTIDNTGSESGTGDDVAHDGECIQWTDKERTRIAFCSQRPWIVASSVKSNIVLAGRDKTESGEDFKSPSCINESLYKESLSRCKLREDMAMWPDQDDTEIGERGVSVSGGQKARIALARALYSDADLYLLDDVLSAVDAHVGKDLFFEGILKYLKEERNKAVILATHQLQYMRHADKILVLDKDGKQIFLGSYAELQDTPVVLDSLGVSESQPTERNGTKDEAIAETCAQRSRTSTVGSYSILEEEEGSIYSSMVGYEEDLSQAADRSSRKDSQASASTMEAEDVKARQTIIQSEDRNIGHVSLKTYATYFKSGGLWAGIGALLYAILGQVLSMLADYWLRWWAEESFGAQGEAQYKWIFGILVFSTIAVGYHKAHAWLFFALDASSYLHSHALWAVLHSPMQFFVANPTGRILNRFSRDQNLVDELCPSTFFDFIQCALFCLAALALLCISLPWLLILIPVIYVLFVRLRAKYLKSSREIKRLEAISRSPIYADFSAALDGLKTLRAYKLEDRISASFYNQLDKNQRVWHCFLMVSRWLGFRLDFMCTSILTIMVFLSAALKGSYDEGLIGFALVYTLSLSGLAQWAVRQSAEVENQMTAMERINTYAHLPPERGYRAKYEDSEATKRSSHPPQYHLAAGSEQEEGVPAPVDATGVELLGDGSNTGGSIDIRDLSVTYREDLPPVLQGLSIHIWGGCKAGIVGRTGSGKSSLLLSLLRLNIITKGDILLDGTSLLSVSLEESRDAIAMIPQDPHLFSSTLRYNLDPCHRHSDSELWSALADAHIKEYVASQGQGLAMQIEEGGKNLSVGQRQLISLARAIVRRSRVVLMDEVTASIDYETDKLIQNTIRTSPALKHATIITVAHRLRTIADSDLVGVISAGKFVEVGHPLSLLKSEGSQFKTLAEESNEFEELLEIASRGQESISQTASDVLH